MNQKTWFRIVFCMLACTSSLGLAQNITGRPNLDAEQASSMFLVSSSIPYQFPESREASPESLSAIEVARLASDRCGIANAIQSNIKAEATSPKREHQENSCSDVLFRTLQNAIACRQRQTAAASAWKIHYGIAACLLATKILDETEAILREQLQAQLALVDRGVPIPDPLLVDRLKTSVSDKRLENDSKISTLRMQLSALIGPECACNHSPREDDTLVPSDVAVCEHIDQAMRCRCDLVSLRSVRGTIREESLEDWNTIASFLGGTPIFSKRSPFLWKLFRTKQSQNDIQRAIGARRSWLDKITSERTKQVTMEVELAFERKRTAALRWVNAGEQTQNWEERIRQLEKLSEVQGNLAQQFEAKLNRLQSRAQQLERWVDWHQAQADLILATGDNL